MNTPFAFPDYSRAERAADAVIHIIGVPLGLVAAALLLRRAILEGPHFVIVVLLIYVIGLVGMLGASAAYQLTHPGLIKERLRRLDRSMIFAMIAGTYTPISATILYAAGGVWLCALLWAMAAIGIYLTLRFPRRFERFIFALYLAMGWMLIILIHACYAVLPAAIFALIVGGGLLYTIGAVVQSFPKLKYNNPIWHALVLSAASAHYAAISLQLTGGIG